MVTSCNWEMNQGTCQFEALQQTIQAVFLWSARRYQVAKKSKLSISDLIHAIEGSATLHLSIDSLHTLIPKLTVTI